MFRATTTERASAVPALGQRAEAPGLAGPRLFTDEKMTEKQAW